MKKKKLTALLLVLCMGVAALSGCGSREDAKEDVKEEEQQETEEENKEPEEAKPSAVINIGAMNGPTAMGMAQLLDDENYNVSIVASPDEMVPMVVQGQVDIAAIPANLAATLYQKS